MILLRTSYRYGVFLKYYFKLQFSASWSILYHEKMIILRCILPKKAEPPPEKNLTSHLLEDLEHPDKKKKVQKSTAYTWLDCCCSTQHKLYSLLLPPAMGARFYRFLGRPAKRTRWLAGAAAIKSG